MLDMCTTARLIRVLPFFCIACILVCGSKQHAFAGVGEEILESLDKAKSVIPLNHKVFLEVTMKLKDADRPKVTSKKVLVYRKTDKLTLIDDTETHIRRVQVAVHAPLGISDSF